jgi:hypothetical protein
MTALTFSFLCRIGVGVLDWITVTVLPADVLPSHASAMQGVRQADTYGEISFFEATKELVTGQLLWIFYMDEFTDGRHVKITTVDY